MAAIRQVTAFATDLTCQTVGRRAAIRDARHVLYRARLDYPNDPHTNGERGIQDWTLRCSPPRKRLHVAYVGAHVGNWSRSMLVAVAKAGRLALSNRAGTAAFHVVGTNSLYPGSGTDPAAARQVTTITLDGYAEQHRIISFALVKVDADGHDLAVLRGACGLLAARRIVVAQFEYNHSWIVSRGIEFYPGWDPELETFVEGNYVACDPEAHAMLPAVTGWKSG